MIIYSSVSRSERVEQKFELCNRTYPDGETNLRKDQNTCMQFLKQAENNIKLKPEMY